MSPLLKSFHVIMLDSTTRNKLFNICNENKGDALLCLMMTRYEIIVACTSESVPDISSEDIVLIQNLIFSSESLRQTESWVPICLPGISDSGYLQMYCNFIEEDIGLVYITESQELSYFLKFTEQSAAITEAAAKDNLFPLVKAALEETRGNFNIRIDKNISTATDVDSLIDKFLIKLSNENSSANRNSIINTGLGSTISSSSSANSNSNNSGNSIPPSVYIDPLGHTKYMICKHKALNQFITYKINTFDKMTFEQNNIITYYCELFDLYNSNTNNNSLINQNNFFHYQKNENMTNVIHTTSDYILFATFNFFKEFDLINTITTEILKLIKTKEMNFFISKYQ